MSATRRPWFKFYPGDWRADQAVQSCSLAARGLWHEMLGLMHEATPYGYLMLNGEPMSTGQLSMLVRSNPEEVEKLIAELEAAGVFSWATHRGTHRGKIYSRRMIRDEKRARMGKKHADRRWEQETENAKKNTRPNGGPKDDPMGNPMLARANPEPRSKKESKKEENEHVKRCFEIWWPHVPKKVDKEAAKIELKAALKKVDFDTLLAATKRWAETCEGKDREYIKGPARWLRAGCWTDEDIAPTPKPNGELPYQGEYETELYQDYKRLRGFLERGYWDEFWGAKPGEDGCSIDPKVMAEHGPETL